MWAHDSVINKKTVRAVLFSVLGAQCTTGWWRIVVASYSQNKAMCSLWLQQPSEKQKRYEYKFPCFPKDYRLLRAWIQAVGRTSKKPKNSRMCSEHFDSDYFEYTVRLQNELLGSCPWKRKLKPEVISTIFPHKTARSVHVVTFGFLYTSRSFRPLRLCSHILRSWTHM